MEKMGKGGPQPLPRLYTNPQLVKHPVAIQDGGIEPIYLAFRIPLITPALQANPCRGLDFVASK